MSKRLYARTFSEANDLSLQLSGVAVRPAGSGGFVLGELTIEFRRGVTLLVGLNGAGKSTLFRTLSEIRHLGAGEITLAGRPVVDSRKRYDVSTGQIGYMPQASILPTRSRVTDFLHYVGWIRGLDRKTRTVAVERVLTQVDLLDRAGSRIATLSGGMRRRVELAATLLTRPSVLLLDEPTVGLDIAQQRNFREVVGKLGSSTIVIVSSHVIGDIAQIADRVVLLADGRITHTLDADDGPLDTRAIGDLLVAAP